MDGGGMEFKMDVPRGTQKTQQAVLRKFGHQAAGFLVNAVASVATAQTGFTANNTPKNINLAVKRSND